MIYLIKSGNALKIGYTSNIKTRIVNYKTHNLDLELLYTKEGSRSDEKKLHSLCNEYKIENEWFKYNNEVIEIFNNFICTGIKSKSKFRTKSFNNNQKQLVHTEKTINKNSSEVGFYMTFIDFAAPIFELKQGLDKAIIAKLCCVAEFNTGTVLLPAQRRTALCESLEISKQQLTNSIGRLKKLNLISGSGGQYLINPLIFWKGDIKTRNAALKNNEIKMVFNFTLEE